MRSALEAYLNERIWTGHNIVCLDESDENRCRDFARAVTLGINGIKGTHEIYNKRYNCSKEKAIEDHFCAKLSELAIWSFLRELPFFGKKLIAKDAPDFKLYSEDKKSFSRDIEIAWNGFDVKCHIKTQKDSMTRNLDLLKRRTKGSRKGTSWVFEKKDKLLIKLLNAPEKCKNDLLALTRINDESQVVIVGFIWAQDTISSLGPMVVEKANSTKVALYLAKLEERWFTFG